MRPHAKLRPSHGAPLLASALVLFAGAVPLPAQQQISSMPLGSVIKGFVMPQRNAAGDLVANITGAEANVTSLNRTRITGLKIELYEEGKVATVITAPACDYWTLEKRLSGHDGVLIEKPQARITAGDVDWDFKTQTAVLHRNVRVVLSRFSVGEPSGQAPALKAPAPSIAPLPSS